MKPDVWEFLIDGALKDKAIADREKDAWKIIEARWPRSKIELLECREIRDDEITRTIPSYKSMKGCFGGHILRQEMDKLRDVRDVSAEKDMGVNRDPITQQYA
jgi:hypothetical protein